MKKKYIRPIVMLIDADISSNVMAGSGGSERSGGASYKYGGGNGGEDNSSNGSMTYTEEELDMGTKGSIFTWSDDYDNEYYD